MHHLPNQHLSSVQFISFWVVEGGGGGEGRDGNKGGEGDGGV